VRPSGPRMPCEGVTQTQSYVEREQPPRPMLVTHFIHKHKHKGVQRVHKEAQTHKREGGK